MSVSIKVDTSEFASLVRLAKQDIEQVREDAFDFFHDLTPYRTGNAKNNTYRSGKTIQANYPYAGRLDEGYSRQAPSGMSEPTIEHIEKTLIPRAIRRANRGK
jgi:hypothetical protein